MENQEQKFHYYVLKHGRCLSDFDNKFEAERYAKKMNGELAVETINN